MDVFTYGTLMDSDIMTQVSGQSPENKKATLTGYLRRRMSNEAYPAIRAEANSVVEGKLYIDISPDAVKRLDAFEGDQYERREVTITTEEGEQVAHVYVLKDEFHSLMSQDEWTLEWFHAHGKNDFMAYEGFDAID